MSIEIIEASASDSLLVFEFLLEHFYPEVPVCHALGRIPTYEEASHFLLGLESGLSFLAVEKDAPDVICGLAINKFIKRGEWEPFAELEKNSIKYETKETEKVYRNFILHIGEAMNNELIKKWDASHTNVAFDLTVLSVSKSCRRRNIANLLMEESIDLARSKNIQWMTIECTSAYSAALAEKHGFKIEYQINYADYKDEGKVVIRTKPPHTKFTLLIKNLSE